MDSHIIRRPLTPGRVLKVSSILGVSLAVTVIISLMLGTANVSLEDVLRMFFHGSQVKESARLIVLKIRLPRIFLAGFTGFSLSLGGLVFQALLRNPLADPFVLGVSSGAAFGAVMGIIFGVGFSIGVPLFSFCGALLTIYLVLTISRRKMGVESATAILAGVIVNAFFTAIIMFFIATSSEDRLHSMLFWLYGDLSQSQIAYSGIIAPVAFFGFALLYSFSRHLNLLAAGEEAALHLGVNVERAKFICFITVSLMVGLVVSFSGLIGFVGLIVPHLSRMILGSDHRLLMPVSALGGALFLIVADTAARTVISPSELPVGVITAFLGAPFFIYLLKTRGSRWTR
ncbi:MAG: iron ABC transporter permease [Deltaproteobacteria bacterium]|nr:iron ABC transporter permease [Deltaproteobacteria bacterium]MBW1930896.1 iron ABC transporter permease [Deltaproteobacteria bacterium]RLB21047.1 MAG: iron ABC transporter permease [Deltaproteobacteria bacterium]